MNRKILKAWVHCRKNAPLIHTVFVVLGIFALFQNCGKTYGPGSGTQGNPLISGSPTASPSPKASPDVGDPIDIADPSTGSNIFYPIATDSSKNPLFQPGRPFGLAVDANFNVAIAATQGPLVHCNAKTGVCTKVVSQPSTTTDTPRPNPIGVAILPDSRIAYIDYDSRTLHLQVVSPDAKNYVWQVTSLGFAPHGIASNGAGTKVYISGEDSVGAVCALGSSVTTTQCTESEALAGFDVAVDRVGTVYVANGTTLQMCNELLNKCTPYAFPDGRTIASGVAVGSAIFVSDYFNGRVLKCQLLRSGLSCSEFVRSLNIPRALRLDSKSNLYIAEYNSGRVIRLDSSGRPF